MNYGEIITIFMLALNSITDYKYKKINKYVCLLTIILTAYGIFSKRLDVSMQSFIGAGMGILFILLNLLLRVNIGIGDGIIIMIMGFICGIWTCTFILLYAFLMASVIGLIIIKIKHERLDYELAFVPFLFAGYILEIILCKI